MEIKYNKTPTLAKVIELGNADADYVGICVESIDGKPVAECDAKTIWRAAPEVADFLFETGLIRLSSNPDTNDDGDSSSD